MYNVYNPKLVQNFLLHLHWGSDGDGLAWTGCVGGVSERGGWSSWAPCGPISSGTTVAKQQKHILKTIIYTYKCNNMYNVYNWYNSVIMVTIPRSCYKWNNGNNSVIMENFIINFDKFGGWDKCVISVIIVS